MAARRDTAADRDEPWDARILALIDAGVDATLIAENLRRTPTERLERLQQTLAFVESVRRERHPQTR